MSTDQQARHDAARLAHTIWQDLLPHDDTRTDPPFSRHRVEQFPAAQSRPRAVTTTEDVAPQGISCWS
ncbi:hypothetical protein AB0N09_35835 [Streptomyces erythrochromogenes]|uniref:hypothetical protein n=1 Tax=Streptomyces erythrochromogenes TaxID=285574 RepID=UPI003417513D